MKRIYIALFVFGTIFFTSCQTKTTTEETVVTQEEEQEENTGKEVELNSAQKKAAGIVLGQLEDKNLSDVIKVNGQTELPPQNQADVTTFLSGTITQILVNIGDRVNKGQVLAIADSPEYIKLQEDYQISKNNLEYLDLEYKRQQTLRAENVNSEKTYQKTKSELNIEKSRYQSLTNQLSLVGAGSSRTLKIVAPISGNVSAIPIRIGTNIVNGQTLFSLVDNSKIHLDLKIYEKDLPYVHEGQKVSFNLTNINKAEVTATIFSIGKAFEPGTKTVIAHANIDQVPDNLIPGLYVNALIDVGEKTVKALPNEAIIKADGREFIFIADATEEHEEHFHYKRVEVKTGVKELGFTQVDIIEAVPDQYSIVTQGAYYLQSHLIKNEGGGGHSH
ncbi:cobalt-zinc-cadmium efflux system membrane fusion protein [Myroides gitamensis]|uniref:Cation efflux system protein CzcB n=1 Tax=Myroides odoratus TaxID=256 RepID=A0A378RMR5_MYROD|nr:efflux RND transporter periplasmic adaptor subunit [Myroides odoratus]MCS4238137.1 cobalt-zinc-cadmium efflux system membrane fusion protein [Myroides odoratus]MDH6600214.1 cobalt-zinc-cadmium efflux system membrane fusion protein [Myroides gitamensis]QQU04962.1 efflux RND transporter periplasmic adaptor subunit [Myroides odoratus]STZ27571.1 Cation efflux system protein CzcB [Myroides odoratus]